MLGLKLNHVSKRGQCSQILDLSFSVVLRKLTLIFNSKIQIYLQGSYLVIFNMKIYHWNGLITEIADIFQQGQM